MERVDIFDIARIPCGVERRHCGFAGDRLHALIYEALSPANSADSQVAGAVDGVGDNAIHRGSELLCPTLHTVPHVRELLSPAVTALGGLWSGRRRRLVLFPTGSLGQCLLFWSDLDERRRSRGRCYGCRVRRI